MIDPEPLAELVTSIAKFGIIQPLLFRDAGKGQLTIVAGERRWQAAQQVGLTTLPAIFVEGNYAELALVENLQRQDLTSVEEAEALQRLMNEQNFTQEQLGGIVGKARTSDERENLRVAFVDFKNQIDGFLNPKPMPS